jgi:hypothetical protein
MNLQEQVNELIASQRSEWKEFDEALLQLDNIKVKTFRWGKDVSVSVQFNPGRMVSTAANIDKQSIEHLLFVRSQQAEGATRHSVSRQIFDSCQSVSYS